MSNNSFPETESESLLGEEMQMLIQPNLVIPAHSDDEVIGCGGTIARLVNSGSLVKVLFLADGELARTNSENKKDMEQKITSRKNSAMRSLETLGAQEVGFLNLPDNRMDTVPLIEIVQDIEEEILTFKPESVLTHSAADLNIDHAIALRATLNATRPKFDSNVKFVGSFEIPSSTNLGFGSQTNFKPGLFVDVTDFLSVKNVALKQYPREIPISLHPRSLQALERNVKSWGDFCGVQASEAFEVQRILI